MTFYAERNFKTKKALKDAVANGKQITIYPAGLGAPKKDGVEAICGPWYPQPHTWYAEVTMKDGVIVKVK
jgi:hypothetical protein